jgi:hypothetical protein
MSKQSLIADASAALNELLDSVSRLDEAAMSERAFGEWNIKQMLAHIGGWQRLNAEMLERIALGEHPVAGGMDYGETDVWNARFAAEASTRAAADAIGSLHADYNRLLEAAHALPDERFTEGRIAERILAGNGIAHVREHLAEIHDHLARRPA